MRTEIRLTTGRKSAAAPTFCMKDEITPTVPEMIGMIRRSVRPPYFRIVAATLLISPVRSNPAPMIITAMIEITALEAKPSKRCCVSARFSSPGSWLSIPRSTMINIAERSIRKISVTNSTTVRPRIAITAIISKLSTTVPIYALPFTDQPIAYCTPVLV